MARRLFTLLSALSLLLCVAVVALWVQSCAEPPTGVREPMRAGRQNVFLDRGRVVFLSVRDAEAVLRPESGLEWGESGPEEISMATEYFYEDNADAFLPEPDWRRLGFGWETEQVSIGSNGPITVTLSVRTVQVPFWLACLVTAAGPVAWALKSCRWRRRHRPARGLCPSCGYDLRATPGRCPECGAAAAGKEP